jgi:hypothetical protein
MRVAQLSFLLFGSVVICLILLITLLQRGRARALLKQKFAQKFSGAKSFPALHVDASALTESTNFLSVGTPGFLIIGQGGVEFLGVPRRGSTDPLEIKFDPSSRMNLIPSTLLAMGIPDMVRVANDEGVHFILGTGAGNPSRKRTNAIHDALRGRFAEGQAKGVTGVQSNQALIAALLVLPLVAMVGFLIHLSLHAGALIGPQSLTKAPDGSILAATEADLLILDADGRLKSALAWRDLGTTNGVSGLAVRADGKLLAGDFAQGQIKLCDLEKKSCSPLPEASKTEKFRGAFSFAVDPKTGTIFASDTGRHRMLRIAPGGAIAEEYRGEDRKLCYPNKIVITADGKLLVADTNNFRILEWPAYAEWPRPDPVEHEVVSKLPTRYGCNSNDRQGQGNAELDRMVDYRIVGDPKPMGELGRNSVWVAQFDVAADGRIWAIFNADNVRRGEAAVLKQDWTTPSKLSLPEGADPWDIAAFGDGALVADPVAEKIYRFGSYGQRLADFASADLESHFEPAHAEKALQRRLKTYLLITIGLLLPGLIISGLHFRKRRIREIVSMA